MRVLAEVEEGIGGPDGGQMVWNGEEAVIHTELKIGFEAEQRMFENALGLKNIQFRQTSPLAEKLERYAAQIKDHSDGG